MCVFRKTAICTVRNKKGNVRPDVVFSVDLQTREEYQYQTDVDAVSRTTCNEILACFVSFCH